MELILTEVELYATNDSFPTALYNIYYNGDKLFKCELCEGEGPSVIFYKLLKTPSEIPADKHDEVLNYRGEVEGEQAIEVEDIFMHAEFCEIMTDI